MSASGTSFSRSKFLLSLLSLVGLMMGWKSATLVAAEPTLSTESAQPTEKPEEILQRADAIRSPSGSFRMQVKVASAGEKVSTFEVWISGRNKTLIKTLSPDRDKGRNLLMLGEDMWAFIPNLKRTVRVSLSQRLMGDAANGDIARLGWHGDYAPTLQSSDAKTWTLDLKALRRGLTYERLTLVVEKNTYRPLKASYLGGSGLVLKTAEFQSFQTLAGETRPSVMAIVNVGQEKKQEQTLITIEAMEPLTIPELKFSQSNLGNP